MIVSELTWSSMDAFAQRIPPSNERELEWEVAHKLLVELTETMTSSAPSQLIIDQPSSLNPLTASLKPLKRGMGREKKRKNTKFVLHMINVKNHVYNYNPHTN